MGGVTPSGASSGDGGGHGGAVPQEIERRWLLRRAPDLSDPLLAGAPAKELEQTYLRREADGRPRVRATTRDDGTTTYRWTLKTGSGLVREEAERDLSHDEYVRLRDDEADPGRVPVVKTRRDVEWQGRTWELDDVRSPVDCWLLEVEVPDEAAAAEVGPLPPPCAAADPLEVTDDPAWTNASLARRGAAARSGADG